MSAPDQNPKELAADEESFFQESAGEPDPLGIGERVRERHQRRRLFARAMMVAVLLLGLVFFYWILDDLLYFFRSSTPLELGRAESLELPPLRHGDYARIEGIARDMCIRAEVFFDKVRFLYFLGSEAGARIVVQSPAAAGGGCDGAVERDFAGRVLDLSRSGRYHGILAYYRSNFPAAPAGGPVYLLQDGVRPGSAWVYPLAFFAVLALWLLNARTLWRLSARSSGRRSASPTADQGEAQ